MRRREDQHGSRPLARSAFAARQPCQPLARSSSPPCRSLLHTSGCPSSTSSSNIDQHIDTSELFRLRVVFCLLDRHDGGTAIAGSHSASTLVRLERADSVAVACAEQVVGWDDIAMEDNQPTSGQRPPNIRSHPRRSRLARWKCSERLARYENELRLASRCCHR